MITLEDLQNLDTRVWTVLGIVAWYAIAGKVMQHIWDKPKSEWDDDEYILNVLLWIVSPFLTAFLLIVGAGGILLSFISGGLVDPPWRWSVWKDV